MTSLLHIVIPCFNEAQRIPLCQFKSFLLKTPISRAIITFINDGSTDDTLHKLLELKRIFPNRIEIISYSENQGKAIAVRLGILKALSSNEKQSKLISYLDADLAVSLEECYNMTAYFNKNPNLICCFSSRITQANNIIKKKISRHIIGRIIANITRYILKTSIHDTQCGCKLFTSKAAKQIFKQPFVSSWVFDIEIFARIIKSFPKEYKNVILEIPVKKWINHNESKVPISYGFKIIPELYQIYRYLHQDRH